MKTLLKLFRIGCFLFLVAAGFMMWFLHQSITPAASDPVDPIIIEIPEGATGVDIAELLESKGVIRSAFALRLAMRASGHGSNVKAGHYQVDANESPLVILKQLGESKPLTRRATFPEGLTLKQVADVVGREKVADASRFLKLVSTAGKQFGPGFPDDLEGYLFPDTYEFAWDVDEKGVAERMTGRFREVWEPLWKQHGPSSPLQPHEAVILASLIEREASVPSERPIIASVYLNRLKKGMLLQCDATVQYALGQPKKILTYADLDIESPYNTYRHPGLPPGPIANPGRASLEAAVNPEPTSYLFYVRNDVKNDGSHVFTRSYEEHQDAIRKYQR